MPSTSSTYNLKLHRLSIELDGADFLSRLLEDSPVLGQRGMAGTYEIDTDSRNVGFGVGVIGETKQQARLSYTRVTDEEELEEVVVSAGEPC